MVERTDLPAATEVPPRSDRPVIRRPLLVRPSPRLLLALAALLLIQNATRLNEPVSGPAVGGLVISATLLAAALFAPLPARGEGWWQPLEPLVIGATVLFAGFGGVVNMLRRSGEPGPVYSVVLLYLVLLAVVIWPPSRRVGRAALAGFLLVQVLAALLLLHQHPAFLDVNLFEHDSARALLSGQDPYAITFRDIYRPQDSAQYYGPGVAVGGRVLFGYPYPPFTLLAVLPGYLLGDLRYVHLAALVLTFLLLLKLATDSVGRAAAALAMVPLMCVWMFSEGWVEPMIVLLLAAFVVADQRRWRLAPMLLGLLLVSKQYFVVVLPLVWLLRGPGRRSPREFGRLLLEAAATGLAVLIPFVLWNPHAFWHSVVELQFRQPFRLDSLSVLVWSVHRFGWPPPSSYGWLPLLAGLLAAALAAWRAPRTPAGFAGGLAFSLFVTILLSKQAFVNYYVLVLGAMATAIAAWPAGSRTGPEPEPDLAESSQRGQPEARQAPGPGARGARIP